ncbi:MAG: hypothetical protein NT041_00500 [Candidatus Vogelbacteria bacterium]|nr:hypothetical protein [Candidatus Vogelbacteria bacterium]
MQDINNKAKKSLRDIFPEFKSEEKPEEIVTNYYTPDSTSGSHHKKFKLKGWPIKLGIGVACLLIVAGLGYGVSAQFAKVTVKVTPKQGRLLISNTYEATRGGQTGLKFVLASNLQDEATLSVTTTGKETVQDKAKGQIIIYNNYSAESQNIIATTRFQTSAGLIFRTPTAVKIPGLTKDAKGQVVPGQIQITVIADKAGANYNVAPSDFSIPGFKGTPKATKIYARSKVAMSDGFIGERGKVSEVDRAKAQTELKKILTTKITQKLKPQIPDDYILFNDAIVMNFTESVLPIGNSPDKATFKMAVNATGILLNKEELSKYLAAQQVPDYQDELVTITNWPELKFTLQNKDNFNIGNLEKIGFKLEGNGHLVWSFDEKTLKNKLRLATSNNYKEIFDKNFPTVQMATVVFSPPWIRTVPADESKIKVETNVTLP